MIHLIIETKDGFINKKLFRNMTSCMTYIILTNSLFNEFNFKTINIINTKKVKS